MTFEEACSYLYSLPSHEMSGFAAAMAEVVSLDTIQALVSLLGDPHVGLKAVHIAGSKGKGSVAAMLDAILRSAGHSSGLFTSPHLLSPTERIRLNGRAVPRETFAELVRLVRPAIEEIREEGRLSVPTFFEACTAMALLEFSRRRTDVAVFETGLGGRLDATNILSPLLCVITTICLEHTAILGSTVAEIAGEKAGIIKTGTPVIVAPDQPADALEVIAARAKQVKASLVQAPRARVVRFEPIGPNDTPVPQVVKLEDGREFEVSLLGQHQAVNAAVAVQAAQALEDMGVAMSDRAIREGLKACSWPGRLQIVGKAPHIVLDCAHAPAAAQALADSLRTYFRYERLFTVVGMNEDKDVAGFAQALAPLRPRLYLCRADLPRSLPVSDLKARSLGLWQDAAGYDDVASALWAALADAGPADLVCVTGSVYVVGEAMSALGLDVV